MIGLHLEVRANVRKGVSFIIGEEERFRLERESWVLMDEGGSMELKELLVEARGTSRVVDALDY